MPIIKSAKKRVKTSEKSHLKNISTKSKVKKTIKKYNLAISENKGDEASKYFLESVSTLDKAVSKGVISKKSASRNKSKLAKQFNTLEMPVPKKQKPITEEVPKTPKKAVAKKTTKPAEKAVAKAEDLKVKKVKETKKLTIAKKKPAIKKITKTVKKEAKTKTEK